MLKNLESGTNGTGKSLADATTVAMIPDCGMTRNNGHHGAKLVNISSKKIKSTGNHNLGAFIIGNHKTNFGGAFRTGDKGHDSIASLYSTVSLSHGAGIFSDIDPQNENTPWTEFLK